MRLKSFSGLLIIFNIFIGNSCYDFNDGVYSSTARAQLWNYSTKSPIDEVTQTLIDSENITNYEDWIAVSAKMLEISNSLLSEATYNNFKSYDLNRLVPESIAVVENIIAWIKTPDFQHSIQEDRFVDVYETLMNINSFFVRASLHFSSMPFNISSSNFYATSKKFIEYSFFADVYSPTDIIDCTQLTGIRFNFPIKTFYDTRNYYPFALISVHDFHDYFKFFLPRTASSKPNFIVKSPTILFDTLKAYPDSFSSNLPVFTFSDTDTANITDTKIYNLISTARPAMSFEHFEVPRTMQNANLWFIMMKMVNLFFAAESVDSGNLTSTTVPAIPFTTTTTEQSITTLTSAVPSSTTEGTTTISPAVPSSTTEEYHPEETTTLPTTTTASTSTTDHPSVLTEFDQAMIELDSLLIRISKAYNSDALSSIYETLDSFVRHLQYRPFQSSQKLQICQRIGFIFEAFLVKLDDFSKTEQINLTSHLNRLFRIQRPLLDYFVNTNSRLDAPKNEILTYGRVETYFLEFTVSKQLNFIQNINVDFKHIYVNLDFPTLKPKSRVSIAMVAYNNITNYAGNVPQNPLVFFVINGKDIFVQGHYPKFLFREVEQFVHVAKYNYETSTSSRPAWDKVKNSEVSISNEGVLFTMKEPEVFPFSLIRDQPVLPTNKPQTPEEIIDNVDSDMDEIVEDINSNNDSVTEELFDDWLNKTEQVLRDLNRPDVIETIEAGVAQNISRKGYEVVNELLSQKHVWNNLDRANERSSSNKIFNIIHSVSNILNAKLEHESKFIYKNRSLFAQTERFSDSSITFNSTTDQDNPIEVHVPLSSIGFKRNSTKNRFVVATLVVIRDHPSNEFLKFGPVSVNAPIFALVIEDQVQLVDDFVFRITHFDRMEFGDESRCSFWNESLWSKYGCRLDELESNRTFSTCLCNHTTNFAVLMDIAHREIPNNVKNILTWICSSITCLMAIGTMIIAYKYHVVPRTVEEDQFGFRRSRYLINQNICFWLVISHLLILFGLERTENSTVCQAVSMSLFLSLLCTFTFTLMMCALLYRSTSESQLFVQSKAHHFSIVGYFLPLVITSISLIIINFAETGDVFDAFRGEYFCWISSKKYPRNIWFFVVPVTIITISNCVLLVIVTRRIFQQTKSTDFRRTTVMILIFMLSFGLPWLSFVFYINRFFSGFAYLFIILNATQGIALFAEQYQKYRSRLVADYKIVSKFHAFSKFTASLRPGKSSSSGNQTGETSRTNLSE